MSTDCKSEMVYGLLYTIRKEGINFKYNSSNEIQSHEATCFVVQLNELGVSVIKIGK